MSNGWLWAMGLLGLGTAAGTYLVTYDGVFNHSFNQRGLALAVGSAVLIFVSWHFAH